MIRRVIASALFALMACGSAALAQGPPPEPPPVPIMVPAPPEPPPATLRVQVVISRHDDDKTISRVPHTLLVTTGRGTPTQLRIGSRVPVQTGPMHNYEHVGTNMDCSATAEQDGRYLLRLTVEDTTPFEANQADAPTQLPAFRTFRTMQTVLLRDGQTTQFTASTDKVSGEVIRIEVGMTVVK